MGVLYEIKRKLKRNPLAWRYLLNLNSTLAYKTDIKSLPQHIRRPLEDLKANGVATTTIEDLFQDHKLYNELLSTYEQMEHDKAQDIYSQRDNTDDVSDKGTKTFMHFLLGEKPMLDPKGIFHRFAAQSEVKSLADGYYKMPADLRYYNIWHTLPSNAQARESQLWHRDREDLQIFKFFLYLTDVDLGAGPFTYAPGTHLLGPIQAEPEFKMEGNVRRTDDEQMNRLVPKEKWFTATGEKGSIILADTHGFHKGGLARTSDRILYTCMYTSPACDRHYFTK